MKSLLSIKVQRGNGSDPAKTLNEWTSARDQAADSVPFRERQMARIELARRERERAQQLEASNVRKIGKVKP